MTEKKMTFEESMNRLDEIVSQLEANEKSLDETIKLFEEGLRLVKSCEETLKQFETKIDEIMKSDADGETDGL